MNNQEIMNALESLHNPNVYNQALVDCRNLLNLSVTTLIYHFQSWLWRDSDDPELTGGELEYYQQLAKIEEFLCAEGLIYAEGQALEIL
jgi:hypothetical protein